MSDKTMLPLTRQQLRVIVKLMSGMGICALLYVFLSMGASGVKRAPPLSSQRVDVSHLQPGQALQLLWENRPVIILHRSAEQIISLRNNNRAVLDADSRNSEQPEAARNGLRSLSSQWFVALASGMDLGCSLDYLPDTLQLGNMRVIGAFKDSCRGSYYDLAGRVLKGQAATRNLSVPGYRLLGSEILLGDGG